MPLASLLRLRFPWLVALVLTSFLHDTATWAEPRLALSVEPELFSAGEAAILHVRLVDEQGRPAPTPEPLQITIEGGKDLVTNGVEMAAGQEVAELELATTQPGVWKLQVRAEGHRHTEHWIFVPEPLPKPSPTESGFEAGSSLDDVYSLYVPPLPPPVEIPVPQALSKEELNRAVLSLGDIRFDEHVERWKLGPDGLAMRERLLEVSHDPRVRDEGREVRLTGVGVEGVSQRYLIGGLSGLDGSLDIWTGDDPWTADVQRVEVGELRLFAQPSSPRIPEQGKWDAVELIAVWFSREEVPQHRSSPLPIELELRDFVRKPNLDPDATVVIPRGHARTSAILTTDKAQTIRVGARWASSQTDSVEVRFLQAPPQSLVFHQLPLQVRGLGPLRRGVRVGLVDDTGETALSDRDTEVVLHWSSELAEGTGSAIIPAGAPGVDLQIDLPEPGVYKLTARARHGRLTPAEGRVEYRFGLWLALVALLGGLLGALGGATLHGSRKWWRIAILGVTASVLAVLLAVFGILDLLQSVLPGASVLQQKVPVQTTLGILCIALVGGIASEGIIGFFSAARQPGSNPQKAPKKEETPTQKSKPKRFPSTRRTAKQKPQRP